MAQGKAKRYSPEQKQEILSFIEGYGRGGQSAAVEKFGVTAATISAWKKKANGGSAPAARKTAPKSNDNSDAALQTINKLHGKLKAARKELADLEAEFEAAKRAL